MTEPAHSDDPACDPCAAPAPSDDRVRAPRPLRIHLTTRADAREVLAQVRLVIVDEWRELLGNKRGMRTQLALARLTH
ncbi:hypothetical protein HDG37_002129 [Paraburkholderia sp. MM5384-R2]|nr:hypothetical protein [Paraburkholderia sp. MM5384-R2]